MKPASELAHIAFPKCGRECAMIEYLGAGECENVCRRKFKPVPGNPDLFVALSQNKLDELNKKG